jgi:multidrug efflux system outer membrane protein
LNNYENTYLNALREVEDAMIAVTTYQEEFELRRSQVIAAEDAARLSWIRYDGGLTSYLEVLDLQRSTFSSQLRASESLQLQLTSTVLLYQALGGGWVPQQDTLQLGYE